MVSAVHAGQFDGKYRLNKHWDCKSVGMDGGAMEIRGGKLHGVESLCLITNPTKIRGMDAVLYDLQCSGEGENCSYFQFDSNQRFKKMADLQLA